jgi:hypothetical protein
MSYDHSSVWFQKILVISKGNPVAIKGSLFSSSYHQPMTTTNLFYGFVYSGHFIQIKLQSILFMTGLSHLA